MWLSTTGMQPTNQPKKKKQQPKNHTHNSPSQKPTLNTDLNGL